MFKFIARRILETIPVLFIIVTGSFFLMHAAPGGPFDSERRVTPEIQRNLEAHYGLNKPLYAQYFDYLGKLIFHGDLGPSFKYANRTVNELILESLPVSMELGCYGMVIALLIGVTAGIVASLRPNSLTDYIPMTLAMTGVCLPTFVLGPLLILIFALWMHWFNPSGWFDPADRVLPALTLGIYYAAYLARLTRGGMLEILSQDYIRTARAKGAGETRVILKHALRGGLLPVVSFLGPALAGIISGSFVVETIFQIPGLGRYFVTAAFNRDYTMVLGTVIFYAVLIIGFNLLVDIVQVWLNPRLRFD
jgi:oligopeptide transport system permease protein